MTERPPILDYDRPATKARQKFRRIFYCLGLPLIGFVLGYDLDHRGDPEVLGATMAVGCFLVSFALPVRD
jgi:hypothetical protein